MRMIPRESTSIGRSSSEWSSKLIRCSIRPPCGMTDEPPTFRFRRCAISCRPWPTQAWDGRSRKRTRDLDPSRSLRLPISDWTPWTCVSPPQGGRQRRKFLQGPSARRSNRWTPRSRHRAPFGNFKYFDCSTAAKFRDSTLMRIRTISNPGWMTRIGQTCRHIFPGNWLRRNCGTCLRFGRIRRQSLPIPSGSK